MHKFSSIRTVSWTTSGEGSGQVFITAVAKRPATPRCCRVDSLQVIAYGADPPNRLRFLAGGWGDSQWAVRSR
jgi:hypothetical protein